jgi:Asp-tRNA(Asn)/Glu-tRNA(Gln) amidotransferase A subunit family amidase
MPSLKPLPHWLSFDRVKPALLTGIVLFMVSYVVDVVMDWLHRPTKAVFFNNLAVGIVGAVMLILCLSASYEAQVYARAKERMILIEELNHHIRQALMLIEESAMLENRAERIRRVDEAIAKVDVVLTELVPTVGSATAPRYSLPVETHT